MRKLTSLFLDFLLVVVLAAHPAMAAIGIGLDVTKQYSFLNCAASAAQTIPVGTYLVTVTKEDTWECIADASSTCTAGTGGGTNGGSVRLPVGAMFVQSIGAGGKSVSCYSAASTGNIVFTRAN